MPPIDLPFRLSDYNSSHAQAANETDLCRAWFDERFRGELSTHVCHGHNQRQRWLFGASGAVVQMACRRKIPGPAGGADTITWRCTRFVPHALAGMSWLAGPAPGARATAVAEANTAVAWGAATGRRPGLAPGPVLPFGAVVTVRGRDPAWPVYPHEAGITPGPALLAEFRDAVRASNGAPPSGPGQRELFPSVENHPELRAAIQPGTVRRAARPPVRPPGGPKE